VHEPRDVIEAMLPDSLDLVGWELRKTLRLLVRRNIELNEWLGSPIVYREAAELRQQLLAYMRQLFNPAAALHHYSSMAAHTLAGLEEGGQISIKKLFYVHRPLLACRWIVRERTQPPTSFLELLRSAFVTPQEHDLLAQLLERKAQEREAVPIELPAALALSLQQEIEQHRATVSALAPEVAMRPPAEELDKLLRRWVG
jgi:predicted nucleotidyltransferase